MNSKREIYLAWSIKDVYRLRPDLNEEQAGDVLESVFNNHDIDEVICDDIVLFWADSLYPRNKSSPQTEQTSAENIDASTNNEKKTRQLNG